MIVLYKGARGRGKTLSMVKDAFNFYSNGYRVLSNFHTTFTEHISNEEVLKLSKGSLLYNCVLCLDELQMIFDSRNFGKTENKSFSYFVAQIRKRNIIILGATQYQNTVDLRFRQHIDVVAFPDFNQYNQLCIVKYFDLTFLEDLHPKLNIKPVTTCFDARAVFPLYDTFEMFKEA